LREGHYHPAQLAYKKLKSGFHLLAPQTVLHFTIDLYNCSVEMFQKDEVKKTTEWASIALDCANSKDFGPELGSKRNSIILNTSRLLGRYSLFMLNYINLRHYLKFKWCPRIPWLAKN
jgi:hypothetical protein